MKLLNKINLLSKNKMVLYVLYFITVLNVFGYLSMNNFKSFALFTLILYVTTFFSKNTAIILIVPLVITNLFGDNIQFVEGLKNKGKKNKKKKIKEGYPMEELEEAQEKGYSMEELEEAQEKAMGMDEDEEEEEEEEEEEFVSTKARKNERASMEKQYDTLTNMIGAEGIQQMTNDTKKLIDKQKSLNESMKAMGPLLNNAKGLLEGFDLDGLSGVQDAINSLAKKK